MYVLIACMPSILTSLAYIEGTWAGDDHPAPTHGHHWGIPPPPGSPGARPHCVV